ncbi:hypothetical protein NQ318_008372 [Aromia moschata]|uniref:N-acylneuraminate-9-phosphatase n=1 Tax=Aromia moschata TaxID=1265417 RepID=A0AAV8YGZ7_9CUCU|nr:hypothetical protein NQ318_008372 [Aromia moschata]
MVYQEWVKLRYKYLALTPEWEKVDKLSLRSYFDIILVSGDLPWEKPHHKIFHEACGYLGVEPHQCIMVGDKLDTDILGGIRAQLGGTVWIPLSSHQLDDNDPTPDYVIDHVTKLPNLLPQVKCIPNFRNKMRHNFNNVSLPDIDDCSSNSSDGS